MIAVLVAALAVRTVYLTAYLRSPFFDAFRNDQIYYREWGLRIAAGNWLGEGIFEQGPLYAYLLGILYRVFGPRDLVVLALQLLGGLATVALAAWCARRLWGTLPALLAGALAALSGPLVFYECMIMKTFLEPLLIVAAIAAGLKGLEGGRRWWFAAAGAAIGLACLVREVHVLLLAAFLPAAWLSRGSAGGSRPRRLIAPAIVFLAFLAVLAPSILRNRLVGGETVIVSAAAGQNLYLAFGPYATGYYAPPPFLRSIVYQEHEDFREEAFLRTGRRLSRSESSRYWFQEAVRWVRAEPGRTLRLIGRKAAILFNDYEVPDNEDLVVATALIPPLRFLPTFGWIAGLGLLGLVQALRRGGAALLPAGCALALALEILLTFNLGRYRAAFSAVWLLFAAGGLAWLLSRGFWRRDRTLAHRLALLAVGAAVTLFAFRTPPGKDQRVVDWWHDLFKTQVQQVVAFREQLPVLRQQLSERPGDPGLLTSQGFALGYVGRLAESIHAYEEALRIDPAADSPRFRLAEVLARTGQTARAAVHARYLVARNPGHFGGWLLLGAVLVRQYEHAAHERSFARLLGEARTCFAWAVGLNPQSVDAHLGLGKVLYLAGDRPAALRELERARSLALAQKLPIEQGRVADLIAIVRRP